MKLNAYFHFPYFHCKKNIFHCSETYFHRCLARLISAIFSQVSLSYCDVKKREMHIINK